MVVAQADSSIIEIYLSSFNAGSILIAFDMQGDLDSVQADMLEDLSNGNIVLSFNGHTLRPDNYLMVDGKEVTTVSACRK